jgi:hypothetical protein
MFVLCVSCLQVFAFIKEVECGCFGLPILNVELASLSCLFLAFYGGSHSFSSDKLARFMVIWSFNYLREDGSPMEQLLLFFFSLGKNQVFINIVLDSK